MIREINSPTNAIQARLTLKTLVGRGEVWQFYQRPTGSGRRLPVPGGPAPTSLAPPKPEPGRADRDAVGERQVGGAEPFVGQSIVAKDPAGVGDEAQQSGYAVGFRQLHSSICGAAAVQGAVGDDIAYSVAGEFLGLDLADAAG